MTHTDFKKDLKKIVRIKYKLQYGSLTKQYIEYPHLGLTRYYVCPWGIIEPDEIERWGLYWFRGNKFYLKKESDRFVRNIFEELSILSHAMRKYVNSEKHNIIINKY